MSVSKRPTSRVAVFALELAVSGVALLFASGTALADTITTVDHSADQSVSGDATSVHEQSSETVSVVSGQTVTGGTNGAVVPGNGGAANSAGLNTNSTANPSSDATPATSTLSALGASSLTPATNGTVGSSIAGQDATGVGQSAPSMVPAGLGSVAQSTTHPVYVHFSTIFSQAALPELATTPASTNPEPVQSPIKPTGLLGQLADRLTTVVVPAPIRLIGSLPIQLTALAGLTFIILLLTDLITRSFGQTLRRSGYAHAARGDVPTILFAPPHLLGYVPVSSRAT